MSYKDEQREARQSTKPRVIEQHNKPNRAQRRFTIPSNSKLTKKYNQRPSKTREAVIKIEEIRHLFALARRGEL